MKPGFRSNAEILSVVALDDCNRCGASSARLREQVQQAETRSPASVKPLVFLHLMLSGRRCSAHDAVERWQKKKQKKNAALGSPFGKIDQG